MGVLVWGMAPRLHACSWVQVSERMRQPRWRVLPLLGVVQEAQAQRPRGLHPGAQSPSSGHHQGRVCLPCHKTTS